MTAWTQQELYILQEHSHFHAQTIARKLSQRGFKRTPREIETRLLDHDVRPAYEQLATCFGVSPRVIERWARDAGLPAKALGPIQDDKWHVNESSLKKWILDHVCLIDLSRVDKFWFVDILAPKHGAKFFDRHPLPSIEDTSEDYHLALETSREWC